MAENPKELRERIEKTARELAALQERIRKQASSRKGKSGASSATGKKGESDERHK